MEYGRSSKDVRSCKKNTLYKIVGNKEALLAKVVFSVQDEYTAVLKQATNEDKPLKALYSLTERIPLIFEKYDVASIRELLVQYPKLAAEYTKREERMSDALIALYEKGLEEGFVRKDIDVKFLSTLQRIVREQMIENADSVEEMAHNLRNALIIIIEGVLVRENKPCMK